MREIDFTVVVAGARSEVFARASDYIRFFRGGLMRCRLVSPGEPAPNGVGAVREIRAGGLRFVERITHYEPEVRLDYRIIGGTLPIVHESGRGDFSERGPSATEVRWRSRFSLPVALLGPLLEWVVAILLEMELRRLFRQVERDLRAGF
jgi:hypothetical protein